MSKIKVSYTLFNYWNRNQTEDLINYYFKLKPFVPTEQMLAGQAWDELNNYEIANHKRMLPEFGGLKLKNPKAQQYVGVEYKDIWISTVLDVLDEPLLIENKTGKTSPTAWLETDQVPMYMAVCSLRNIKIERALLIRYNQYEKYTDWATMYCTPELIKETLDMIEEKSNKIYEFLKGENLL